MSICCEFLKNNISVDLERFHWFFYLYMFCLAQDTSPAVEPETEQSFAAIVSWNIFFEFLQNFIVDLARLNWFLNGTLHLFFYYMFCLAQDALCFEEELEEGEIPADVSWFLLFGVLEYLGL